MNKYQILKKLREYTGYIGVFFMIVGAILAITVKNEIPALITLSCFALFVTLNILLDSYLYYYELDLEKGQKKGLLVPFVFEIIFWSLICINFLVSLFGNPSFVYKIIIHILIIISSFLSIFFADLENDKHDKVTKITICILYTIGIIVICAASL